MKTRIHLHGSLRRPAATSISHRESLPSAPGTWLRRTMNAVVEAVGAGPRRRSHLRLVRRNGQPVPAPLRAVVKTRDPRTGRIVAGVVLTLFLVAAGIGGSIYLDMQAPAVSATAAK